MLLAPALSATLIVVVTGIAQSVPVSDTCVAAPPLTDTKNVRVPLTTPWIVSWWLPAEPAVTPFTATQLFVLLPMKRPFVPPEQPEHGFATALPLSVFAGASASYEVEVPPPPVA